MFCPVMNPGTVWDKRLYKDEPTGQRVEIGNHLGVYLALPFKKVPHLPCKSMAAIKAF